MHPYLQYCMPQHTLSRFAGWLANSEIPWLKNKLIRYFINRYPVNLKEAIQEDPFQYKSYNAFFTRQLKPELRPISQGLYDFVSPADGCISMLGPLNNGSLLQAKGRTYRVQDLLGGNEALASTFAQGHFITIYLAPPDYHRVHMPVDGHLTEMIYVPGDLFSVSEQTAENIPNLFARNERIISIFNTSQGKLAVILVGAMIVGSMKTIWAGTLTPRLKREIQRFLYAKPIFLRRGEEMGLFKLGSTVIVLSESQTLNFDLHLSAGHKLRMGQRLGSFEQDALNHPSHPFDAKEGGAYGSSFSSTKGIAKGIKLFQW